MRYNEKKDYLSFPIPKLGTYIYIREFLCHSQYVRDNLDNSKNGKDIGYFKVDKIVGRFIILSQYPASSGTINQSMRIIDFKLGIYRFKEIDKNDIPAEYWKKKAFSQKK